MITDAIDAVLTVLFWLPAKAVGYQKCSRCSIRYRRLQFVVWLTRPLRRWCWLDHHRIDWEMRMAAFEASRSLVPDTRPEIDARIAALYEEDDDRPPAA